MARNFAPSFSLNFLCISQAPLGWALWSVYYWKDLFHLQNLSIDDVNFGQKWWRQRWKAKAHHGLHSREWVEVELQKLKNKSSNINSCQKSCSNCMDTSDIVLVWPWAVYIYFFSVMIWLLCWTLCFKNSIDVRQWLLLVSPVKFLLPHPSPTDFHNSLHTPPPPVFPKLLNWPWQIWSRAP